MLPSSPATPTLPDDSRAPAVARTVAILRLLGRSPAPLGVQAIARELRLVPSTCLYTLRALISEELVAFDPDTKRYSLEAGILTLARQWLRSDSFVPLAQPLLDRIGQRHDVTTMAVQIVGLDHMVVVALSNADAGRNLRLGVQIGSRFPALISATGRCIAAFGDYSDSQIEQRFNALHWDTPPTFDAWRAEVAETRTRGVAIDAGSYIAGVTVLAAPIWKTVTARPSHAFVAIGLSGAMRDALPGLQRQLHDAARRLSARLGGRTI